MIYFIGIPETGAIKIGKSRCPQSRLATLQTGHVSELVLLGMIDEDDSLEARLHERFYQSHLRGEWFRLTVELAWMILCATTVTQEGTRYLFLFIERQRPGTIVQVNRLLELQTKGLPLS